MGLGHKTVGDMGNVCLLCQVGSLCQPTSDRFTVSCFEILVNTAFWPIMFPFPADCLESFTCPY